MCCGVADDAVACCSAVGEEIKDNLLHHFFQLFFTPFARVRSGRFKPFLLRGR